MKAIISSKSGQIFNANQSLSIIIIDSKIRYWLINNICGLFESTYINSKQNNIKNMFLSASFQNVFLFLLLPIVWPGLRPAAAMQGSTPVSSHHVAPLKLQQEHQNNQQREKEEAKQKEKERQAKEREKVEQRQEVSQ